MQPNYSGAQSLISSRTNKLFQSWIWRIYDRTVKTIQDFRNLDSSQILLDDFNWFPKHSDSNLRKRSSHWAASSVRKLVKVDRKNSYFNEVLNRRRFLHKTPNYTHRNFYDYNWIFDWSQMCGDKTVTLLDWLNMIQINEHLWYVEILILIRQLYNWLKLLIICGFKIHGCSNQRILYNLLYSSFIYLFFRISSSICIESVFSVESSSRLKKQSIKLRNRNSCWKI